MYSARFLLGPIKKKVEPLTLNFAAYTVEGMAELTIHSPLAEIVVVRAMVIVTAGYSKVTFKVERQVQPLLKKWNLS